MNDETQLGGAAAPAAGGNPQVTTVEAATAATTTTKWTGFITPFAQAIGKTNDEVGEALKPLVGNPGDNAMGLLQDDESTPFDEIKTLLSDVPVAVLRKAVKDIRKKAAAQVIELPANSSGNYDVLPAVPDDASWLEALKTGGVLKVNQTTVIGAIRAGLAHRAGLFDLPGKLTTRMEAHADELEEPVGEDFFKLRKLLTRRSYAEIFEALEGADGKFVTEARRRSFLDRIDGSMWTALSGFQTQLKGWQDNWTTQMANPAMFMSLIGSAAMGGGAINMPPGMMAPPDTAALRDAAETVVNTINRVFSGTGNVVAAALAVDAQQIKAVLENAGLPAQLGAENKERMLKMLGVDVTADYVRLERNVTRYALAVMQYPSTGSGNEELAFLGALVMLGNSIPWDKLFGAARPNRPTGPIRRDGGNRGLGDE